jgi:CHAT domain-containing protein
LLQRTNNSIRGSNSQAFIGEINYTLGEKQLGTDNEKGTIRNTGYRGFETDSQLLEGILSTLNNVQVINGDNVSIASVMYALKNSDIVHISTHGKFDSDVFSSINSLLDIGLLNGTNVLKSCKLILSGYNDNQHNYLDGYTISQMDLSNISLLFLDACQTAAGKRIAVGSYSFAEAFHYAGVKNIIATLDPISPKVTLDFATRFYRLLKDGMSYHDAFYKTKEEICPSERIILWE